MDNKSKLKDEVVLWERIVMIPKPIYAQDIKEPIKLINSEQGYIWKFCSEKISENQALMSQDIEWKHVQVPAGLAMQGYDIENDVPYYYKTEIIVPSDWKNKKNILRFNGVYSKARVWVNNYYIRSHKGGFTTWDCDISDVIVPGEVNNIVVEFIDDKLDPSIGSKYAHHNIGGIIGDVMMIAVPHNHISKLHYDVKFDDAFCNAQLKLDLEVACGTESELEVLVNLRDKEGNHINLEHNNRSVTKDRALYEISFNIDSPIKWDAEHPYLYDLEVQLRDVGTSEIIEVIGKKVGFREITYGGDRGTDKRELYVNGQKVKLRGTCRHNVHPIFGRTTNPKLDREDVKLLKGQNINYVRTSHYPPSEAFLEACDEEGIYVEEETAVNFQYANGSGPWLDDEEWYMGQLVEMIERDRSHPSILIWSLGNESAWEIGQEGDKFRRQYAYVKKEDTSRPVKFSYPFNIKDGTKMDIYSMHYADHKNGLADYLVNYGYGHEIVKDYEAPVIHDEYAHIACYNINELGKDNNVRSFWSESIVKFWDSILETRGALGGALWANIDDVFLLPEGVPERHQKHSVGSAAGYGEWGNMTDQWRREKPEYWGTKKAYSPVRIREGEVGNPGINALHIPIKNGFNHTNLNEVTVRWRVEVDGHVVDEGQQIGPDVEVLENGELVLPKREWNDREYIYLSFITPDQIVVDEYYLPIKEQGIKLQCKDQGMLKVTHSGEKVSVSNDVMRIIYDTNKAQIEQATYKSQILITGGPYLHITGQETGEWKGKCLEVNDSIQDNTVQVKMIGQYENGIEVEFVQLIDSEGRITTQYHLSHEAEQYKVNGIGIAFDIPEQIDSVLWSRKGFFSMYPNNHIGRVKGKATRVRKGYEINPDIYGKQPEWDWKDDMRNFYLENKSDEKSGLVTRDFKCMRENIYYYSVLFEQKNAQIRVESNATEAATISYQLQAPKLINDRNDKMLEYVGEWIKESDSNCYLGTEMKSNQPGATVSLKFYGTGVNLLYKKDKYTGKMYVSVDQGEKVCIDTHSDIGRPLYQQKYEVGDLPLKEHTVSVEVIGAETDGYIAIDAFEVVNDDACRSIEAKLIINNEWNYEGLSWGNYCGKEIHINKEYSNEVNMRLVNTN